MRFDELMKQVGLVVAAAVAVVAGGEGQGAGLQVRFYPQETVRAYEVSAPRGWNSVLLQNIAVVNDSSEQVLLERVEVELMAEGVPVHFENVELPLADGPREIQGGDIVQSR